MAWDNPMSLGNSLWPNTTVSPLHAMRAFIVFLLSCASVLGADGGIQVFTSAKTNAETASITTKEFYTRDGQTNLVRHTKTKAGVVQIRIHRFYHGGALVGDYVAMPDSSGLTTEAGTPYSVSWSVTLLAIRSRWLLARRTA